MSFDASTETMILATACALGRLSNRGLRLAFVVPLSPWPVLCLIGSQGGYSTGRHSAEPLMPVSGLAYLSMFGVHLIGLLLILRFGLRKEWPLPVWAVFAAINGYLMATYIGVNGRFYV